MLLHSYDQFGEGAMDFSSAAVGAMRHTGKYGRCQMKAAFIEPMLLMRSAELPDGPEWLYEIKLDGYRTVGIRTGGEVQLRSRNDNDFKRPLSRHRSRAYEAAG